MSAPDCSCGFDPWSVTPWFSADWYRAHRDHHLAFMPVYDQGTVDNFEMFIRIASGQSDPPWSGQLDFEVPA